MKPYLAITQGPDKGRVIPIPSDAVVVGRDPACQIALSDAQVSRRHFRLSRSQERWTLFDLNSSNGTLLNGEQVRSQTIKNGDIVILGETMIGFHLGDDVGEQPQRLSDGGGDTQTITVNERALYDHWELDEDVEDLKRARSDLEALYRVGREINSIRNTSELIPAIVDLIFREMYRVDRLSVYLLEGEGGELRCRASRARKHLGRRVEETVYSSTMADQVLREKAAVLTYDAMSDARYSAVQSVHEHRIRAAICAPLMTHDRVMGVMFADSMKPASRFRVDDLRLLAAIGLQAGAAVENALLYEELESEKEALKTAHQDLQTAQSQLVHSEKLAAVGRLASGIVHDMKNPMAVILGYAGLIEKKVKQLVGDGDDQGIPQLLGEVETGVAHVNQVIEQLLMFARPSDPVKERTDIAELLDGVARFLMHEANQAGVKIRQKFEAGLPPVLMDPNHIKQVLINLLINAIEAMEGRGGEIELRVSRVTLGRKHAVEIAVADTGCGISPEQQALIFEPFFSTKQEGGGGAVTGGTGLGLSVSYGIVRRHGGTIDVESSPGNGTTFRVRLPLDSQGAPPDETELVELE